MVSGWSTMVSGRSTIGDFELGIDILGLGIGDFPNT